MQSGDFALVSIRRHRTPGGEPTCMERAGGPACEFLAMRHSGTMPVCEFGREPVRLDEQKPYLVPHAGCVVWKGER